MRSTIKFKTLNNIAGWITFILALGIYWSTVEPTVSFWDCGEFLSCASKLEIPHAPGAPLFILLGRIAAILNPANPTIMINGLSGLESAFTILFLFWTITWLGRKVFPIEGPNQHLRQTVILIAAFTGSMAYAVSDSFWFSAVESEVYALSSLFTAIVFWCITKWEESPVHTPLAEKWLLFIAYLFGLSIGVHLLNLLTIPAILLVYFTKRKPFSLKIFLKSIAYSFIFLFIILWLLIPGIPKFLSWFELFLVNSMGLPYHSGILTGLAVIIILLSATWFYGKKRNKALLMRISIYTFFIFSGFSTYGIMLIRAADKPPVNMNDPEDPFSLGYYLNREQYGTRPLIFGPSYASIATETRERFTYERDNGKYIPLPLNPDVKYDPHTMMWFPRMSSDMPGHPEAYRYWSGHFTGKMYYPGEGSSKPVLLPTQSDNLRYFFNYQLGYMYFRYLFWNFAGRQNDIQGHGNSIYGNWISGIRWLDDLRLGPQDKLPRDLKTNRGHNTYFMLPLLLGLLGMFFLYRYYPDKFWITFLFFFFTGIAIVLYLNEVPVTPRERDYVFVGSFYAFSIWIGIGVIALFSAMEKWTKRKPVLLTGVLCTIGIPVLMFAQNHDDHNRSGRYTVLEYARNCLESCKPGAILFTNADNDTYPLWYAQEVAGIRRDVRIILTPYLSAEWYVNQLRRPQYGQPGVKMSLSRSQLSGGKRIWLPVINKTPSADINELLAFTGSDDPRTKVGLENGKQINFIPTREVLLPVPENSPSKDLRFAQKYNLSVADSLLLTIKGNAMTMDHLMLMDILASNHWQRPVYFIAKQEPATLGLDKYLKLDGYAYELTPFYKQNTEDAHPEFFDTEKLYNQFMHNFAFKSLADTSVYLDNTQVYSIKSLELRHKFVLLATALAELGDSNRANNVLDKISTMLPGYRVLYDNETLEIISAYFKINAHHKGEVLLENLMRYCSNNITYFCMLTPSQIRSDDYDIRMNLYLLQGINQVTKTENTSIKSSDIAKLWNWAEQKLIPQLN